MNAEQSTAWASYCQKCNSTDLQISTESTVSGGHSGLKSCFGFLLFGPLGLLCGNKKIKTEHKSYWVCKGCGNKFRNLTEVIDEAKASQSAALTSCIIWAVVSVIMFFALGSAWALGFIGVAVAGVQILLFFMRKKTAEELIAKNDQLAAGIASLNQQNPQQ